MEAGKSFISVSAVVPVFNGSETLERCLSSVRAQGEALKEIIVVDDASEDSSADIIESFVGNDSRFVLVRHDANEGLSRTLNDGIARATGEAVLIIQQDSELVGKDWVDQGLALMQANYPCCISGHPTYRFHEMAPVDTAFGILRDHYSGLEVDRAELAFSEFKCDLIPRSVLKLTPFETKFRISGEDQVLSANLWRMGYPILRFRQLSYIQRSGNSSSLARQLRKEITYGKTQAGVLVRTAFRAASRSLGSRVSGHRLWSRVSAVASAVGLVSFVVLFLVGAGVHLLIPAIMLPIARGVVVGLRGTAIRGHSPMLLPLTLAVALAPVADLTYSAAVVLGFLAFPVAERV